MYGNSAPPPAPGISAKLPGPARPGPRRLGWGCPRFNRKIFSDVNFAISLNRFFKCVYGMGGGEGRDRGPGRMKGIDRLADTLTHLVGL